MLFRKPVRASAKTGDPIFLSTMAVVVAAVVVRDPYRRLHCGSNRHRSDHRQDSRFDGHRDSLHFDCLGMHSNCN